MRNLLAFQRAPLDFTFKLAREYGDVAGFKLLTVPVVFINHPRHLKHVLQDNAGNYDKDTVAFKLVRPLLGNGLATAVGGKSWLRQRRLLQPAFHRKRIAALGGVMVDAIRLMIDRWEAPAARRAVIDIGKEMSETTLRIVVTSLFSLPAQEEALTRFAHAATSSNKELARYVRFPLVPLSVPTPSHRRFWRSFRVMENMVYEVIDRYRDLDDDRNDLLSMMMRAQDEETGERMDGRQLRDEVFTMLFAGHETSASALTWVWYLLSRHPEVEQRLHEEVDTVLGGRQPGIEDLPNLTCVRSVIDETLRLYPPAWQGFRHAIAEDEIGGHRVPAGAEIFWSMYVMHRHPEIWSDPERFDPERFIGERAVNRDRSVYTPFGAGVRQCIGNSFALAEMQLMVAAVAQRYRLVVIPTTVAEPMPSLTLTTVAPVRMRLEPRG